MYDLDGKVAVITGGASGIGLATGHELGRGGVRPMLVDVEADPLDRAVESECNGCRFDRIDRTFDQQ